MTNEEFIEKLRRDNVEFKQFYDNDLPTIVGTESVNFYSESFQNEGFTDTILEPWQDVKRRTDPKRPDRAAATRKILTGATGDLGRSIEFSKGLNEVKITADAGVGSDKSYAAAHNEGTTTAGRNHNVVIPKRQFIGKSTKLNKIIMDITSKRVARILKK